MALVTAVACSGAEMWLEAEVMSQAEVVAIPVVAGVVVVPRFLSVRMSLALLV